MQDSSQGVIALLTHPVAGNPAQFVIERALAAWGLDTRYLSLEVRPDGLAAAIAGAWAMGFRGLHVDDPHREAVTSLVPTTTDSAARTQVTNCLVRDNDGWRATNTLGAGVMAALNDIGPLADKRIVLLGAGKLARSLAAELATAGVSRLLVVNRTQERGEALSALMRDAYHVDCTYDRWEQPLAVPNDCDVLVNATSTASNDPHARVPLRVETLRRETIVVDATMHPATQLLRDARAQSCPTVDGLAIYVRHVAASLELWTGWQPDLAIMREALEEFLEL